MNDHRRTPTTARIAFGPLDVTFDDSILVPRPWTVAQSTWGRQVLDLGPDGPVLELCSGAGHIGLAAVHGTTRTLVQVDRDETACRYARENAERAGVGADVRCDDLEDAVRGDERFALVLADPPWVPRAGVAAFPDDPVLAIDGGEDGLDLARTCLRVAARHLLPEGAVLLQLGSRGQVDGLGVDLEGARLVVADVRDFERGVLVLLHAGPVPASQRT
ncbi:class I SAM-dependent methyltransferase [Aeromicrobium alkaliterrae]|uniref:Methyltransferase small domain-containing protein n=1 Tax=Aeromicrobium alkaliterrae TaxID=302168 RepID=A0ABN2K7H8_9ACTN